MNKRLIINLSSNVVAFTTNIIIAFILTPYLVTSIGKAEYSFYPISNNIVGYVSLATIALNSMLSRFVTLELSRGNPNLASNYLNTALFSNIGLIFFLVLPMAFITFKLEWFLVIPADIVVSIKMLFVLVFTSLLLSLLNATFSVACFARNRMDIYAAVSLGKGLLKLSSYGLLFYLFKPTIIIIGCVAIISSLYDLFFNFYIYKKLLPDIEISWQNFKPPLLKILISSGFWNVINSLGMTLLLGTSLIMTNRFLGYNEAGDLSLALILPTFISGVISMLVTVLLPRLTIEYSKNDNSFINEVLNSQKILSLISTTPLVVLVIFANDFFKIWIPTNYTVLLCYLSSILLVPLFVHSNMWTLYSVNIVMNQLKIPSLIFVFSGLFSVALILFGFSNFSANIFYIPVVTSSIGFIYYLFFIPLFTSRKLKVNPIVLYKNIIKSFIYVVSYISLLFFIREYIYFDIKSWFDLIFYSFILSVIGYIFHGVIILSNKEKKLFLNKFFFLIRRFN